MFITPENELKAGDLRLEMTMAVSGEGITIKVLRFNHLKIVA